MRTAPSFARFACAALLVLLLGLRALGSVGYMPAVEQGRLELIFCPGGEWAAAAPTMPGMDHRHGSPASEHHQCPYADAGAIPFTADSPALLPVPLLAYPGMAILALSSLVARARVQRPNQTGPPIPA